MKKIMWLGFLSFVVSMVCAETYYLKEDMNTSTEKNSPLIKELWRTQRDGSGSVPTKITGNYFIVNGKSWRTPNSGMTSRFPGAFIIDSSGAKNGELLSAVWKPTIFIIDGKALMRLRRTEVTLQPKYFVVDGTATFRAHSDGSRALFIETEVLKGGGQIVFGKYDSTDKDAQWNLRANVSNEFVGSIAVELGVLSIETPLDLNKASMTINNDAGAILQINDITLVLKHLKVNGQTVAPGLYKMKKLLAVTGGGFSGNGQIKVLE